MKLVVCCCPLDKVDYVCQDLLEKGLASCVNAIPEIQTMFRWKGKIVNREEALLLIQTPVDKPDELINSVANLYPSELPPIITLAIISGHYPYLKWAEEELPQKAKS
jgi:periplasmic divalent cation tolerance protein